MKAKAPKRITPDQRRILVLEGTIRQLEAEKAVWREWQKRAVWAEDKFRLLACDLSHLVRRYQDMQ